MLNGYVAGKDREEWKMSTRSWVLNKKRRTFQSGHFDFVKTFLLITSDCCEIL